MSSFQPINKARRTSKPAAENSSPADYHEPSPALEAYASNLMRASSSQAKPSKGKKRKSPAVVMPTMAPSQALVSSEDSKTTKHPPRKKRKTVQGASKARRKQARRDAKPLPTVEHSARSTPVTGAESDGDWSKSSEHFVELDSDMSLQTANRRSPRHRPSCVSSIEMSGPIQCVDSTPSTRPQRPSPHKASGDAIKREGAASRDRSVIRPITMSPSDHNKEFRDRKLQAEGLVELPPAEWIRQQYLRVKKKKKTLKRLWEHEVRKQKGKEPERGLKRNAETPPKAPRTKIVKPDRKTNKSRKRHKQSHKRVQEEPTDVEAGLQPVQNAASRSEHPPSDPRRDQSGKPALSKKPSKVIVHEDLQPEAVVLQTTSAILSCRSKGSVSKTSDKEVLPQRSTASGCEVLPAYFKQPYQSEPSLVSFGGENAEFLSHGSKIGDCKAHNHEWRNEWSKAENSSAPDGKEKDNGTSNAISRPEDCLSSSRYGKPSHDTYASYNRIGQREKGLSSEQMARVRQQSSIEPCSFYGKQRECRLHPTFDSSPLPDKALTNENKDRDAERSERTTDRMTPPDSSPASKESNKRRKSKSAHVSVESHAQDNWRPLFDDDEARPQPGRSFNLPRRRHQSVPVKLGSRNITVNQRDSSNRFEQRRDDTLQELSKNSILTNNKIDSLRNEVRDLSALTLAQAAAVQPATTPTVAAAAADENRPAQFERRKRKRASAAERQLELPVLDHEVPMELRLPDEDLIEIGRIVSGYERHRRAHYAFSWRGRLLRKSYKYLLDRNIDDGPVWTADEISRIAR